VVTQVTIAAPIRPAPGPELTGLAGDVSPDRDGALTAVTVFLVLLVVLPSRLVVGPLGAAGTPAQIFGIGMLIWWVTNRFVARNSAPALASPVKVAVLWFAAAVLASYIVATTRPIDPIELRAADRALLSLCSWLGVIFVTSETLRSRIDLEILLRRMVTAGGALATLGIAQFVTGRQFINLIVVPGLTAHAQLFALSRDGLNRPAGTAAHPIEFGVVLAMILPFALYYALENPARTMLRRWYPVGALAFAIPISISRSAVLGCAVALVMLLPTWSAGRRRTTYVALVLLLGALYVSVPGLLGTFRNLFFGISQDSSALSRTDSYTIAGQFISRTPIFGRGFMTFLPSYRILDNQYLGTMIDMGFVGLVTLLGLFVTGLVVARDVRRRAVDRKTRALAQSFAASIAVAGFCSATFDALSFPMFVGIFCLVLGGVGALRRAELLNPTVLPELAQPATELEPAAELV
jgi:O-antigen ligase